MNCRARSASTQPPASDEHAWASLVVPGAPAPTGTRGEHRHNRRQCGHRKRHQPPEAHRLDQDRLGDPVEAQQIKGRNRTTSRAAPPPAALTRAVPAHPALEHLGLAHLGLARRRSAPAIPASPPAALGRHNRAATPRRPMHQASRAAKIGAPSAQRCHSVGIPPVWATPVLDDTDMRANTRCDTACGEFNRLNDRIHRDRPTQGRLPLEDSLSYKCR